MRYRNENDGDKFKFKGPAVNGGSTWDETVSVGDWIVTFILSAIPILNLIMLFSWIFDENTKPSKRNFAKVLLVLTVIAGIIELSVKFASYWFSYWASL